ncbi:MAG TPA: hypothetical protein VK149_03560 [Sideroxyarcus sp.]|nr:hypothetical protein [Sideroxyarcus sp.]
MPRNQQLALPIGPVEVPDHLMRAAYERERDRLRCSFEAAMENTGFRICLRHIAIGLGSVGKKRK